MSASHWWLVAALAAEASAAGSAALFAPRPWLRRLHRSRNTNRVSGLNERDCRMIATRRLLPAVAALSDRSSVLNQSYAKAVHVLLGRDMAELRLFCCQHEYSPELSACWESFEEHAHCCFPGLRSRLREGRPTPWVLQAAQLELSAWRARAPIGEEMHAEFMGRFAGIFCELRVTGGKVKECDVDRVPALRDAFGEDRFQYETLLTALRTVALFSNVTGRVVISPHKWDDEAGYAVPVWTRARPSFAPQLVRMPYYAVLSKMVETRTALYADAASHAPPWHRRVDKVFWRGDFTPGWTWCACDGSTAAPSNSPFAPSEARRLEDEAAMDHTRCRCRMSRPTRATWHKSPRLVAVNLSFYFPEDIDARFSKIFSGARDSREWQGILPDNDARLSIDSTLSNAPSRFRYVLDIDGTTISTDRPYSLLATGSVLFKQSSGVEPWLYSETPVVGSELRPFEHFLPIKADLSDLRDQLRWARAHEGDCERIAARAFAWSAAWHRQEYAFEYVHHLLAETASLTRQ